MPPYLICLIRVGMSCCTLLCGGCIVITSGYPKDWSSLEHPTGGCDDELTGVYAMVGEDFTNAYLFVKSSSKPTRLDKYLMPGLSSGADRIEIVGPTQGRLVFTAERGGTAVLQRTLSEHKDFECKDDGISLKENELVEQHGQGSGSYMWNSERFWRSSDGSLMIRRTTHGSWATSFYLIGVRWTEDWSRFPAAETKAATTTDTL